MRGSIVGLSLDSSLADLALKFNATLEAIALQTRHILDEMGRHGHEVHSIYMSGGQAKNAPLMQLLSNVCQVPVVLPPNSGAAVVLGAAVLGRFAHNVTDDLEQRGTGEGPRTQMDADEESERVGERLWDIMVRDSRNCSHSPTKSWLKGRNDPSWKRDLSCCKCWRFQAA
jgi:ribulose kinase